MKLTGAAKTPQRFHVTLPGKEVTPSNSGRDLGIQMDPMLLFDEHVTNCFILFFLSVRLTQLNLFLTQSLENVIDALVFS